MRNHNDEQDVVELMTIMKGGIEKRNISKKDSSEQDSSGKEQSENGQI